MRRLLCATTVGLLLFGSTVAAQPGKKGHKGPKHEQFAAERQDRRGDIDVHVAFSNRDVQVIRRHYAPARRSLPPGLEKKHRRTGQLPPGWQKRMEPLPVAIERELDPIPAGCRRGVIDGRAVIYNPHTHVIVDVAVLF